MKRTEDRTYEQPWGLFAPDTIMPTAAAETRAGDPGVSRGTHAAPPRPLHRLDLSRNNVTGLKSTGRILAKPHRCRCRTCEKCGPIYGRKVRGRLLLRSDEFQHPALLTLTLKPSHFDDDPSKGFLTITDGKFIARLMKHLGVKRWVWVLEFQQSGWPHWHLLIDKPGGFLNLKKAWHWWGWNRTRWKLGGVDLGKQQTKDGRHAIFYITKYLVKPATHRYPDWVLDLKRRVRWVQASRAIGRLVTDREKLEVDALSQDDEEAAASLPPEHRTLRVRAACCGSCVEFLREFTDSKTGEIVYRFCGRLAASFFDHLCVTGRIDLQHDERHTFIQDHGDMRARMTKWIKAATKAGVNEGSRDEREKIYAAMGGRELTPL